MLSAAIHTSFEVLNYVSLVLLVVVYCTIMLYVMLQNSFFKISFKVIFKQRTLIIRFVHKT